MQESSPIFIIGVPRSGTTLLRVLLDSHPHIACGPETPWLCAHHPATVGSLVEYMSEDRHGYAKNFDGTREEVFAAARVFVDSLLSAYARRKGKRRWAEKTPENLRFLPFLRELFPDARIIHLRRNPLDVAISTSVVPAHRQGITPFNESRLGLFYGVSITNNVFNALLRWVYWDRMIVSGLTGVDVVPVQYEELVRTPEPVLRRVLAFAGEDWVPEMLNFMDAPHEFPAWEWGSADVVHYSGSARGITPERTNRAERELTPVDREILETLLRSVDSPVPIVPRARLANHPEVTSEKFVRFVSWYNSFAEPLGLDTLPLGAKHWEYPWLWMEALGQVHWPGKHVLDTGGSNSALPWILAMLGAKVTLLAANSDHIHVWERLRDGLSVPVEWRIAPTHVLPVPDSSVDVVTSFSALDRFADKSVALDEYARVLGPGGLLALSCGIGEPGMHFPPWFGTALSLSEFAGVVWKHPAFGNLAPPDCDPDDIPVFRYWHLHTHEHRDYVTAAAVMRRVAHAALD